MQKMGVFPEPDGVFRLDDGMGASFYLLEGNDAAVLIDTGMGEEPPRPAIERLTRKPVTLLLTHGHPDHVRHAGAFDKVYIHGEDIPIMTDALKRMGVGQGADIARCQRFEDGDTLSIGDLRIRVLGLGGHTAGSVAFHEPLRNLLFTGDAVGSGIGVWMHLKESLPLTQYQRTLRRFSAFLGSLAQQPTVFTGHAAQRYGKPGVDNPVCFALVQDMDALCGMILEGRADRTDAPEAFIRDVRPVYVSEHGRASIIYAEKSIA